MKELMNINTKQDKFAFAVYHVELEIKDTTLSAAGLKCFLEHSLADELTKQQLQSKVTVKVKEIK